ncbi:MAG: hypothetical protein KDA79_23485, partial [Planctomycetaceae bacterium]|nr:hypothetical protein [Planctomycetaceae bacterium]
MNSTVQVPARLLRVGERRALLLLATAMLLATTWCPPLSGNMVQAAEQPEAPSETTAPTERAAPAEAESPADSPPAERPAPREVKLTDNIPWGQPPIDYHSTAAADPVARLDRLLASGDVSLEPAGPQGRLVPLLRLLEIPQSSQVLVFSKTSVNRKLISPASPRAIYFNDEVYVAWVEGAGSLEISAVDPTKGASFYVLPQNEQTPARFRRERSCLACHAGATSLNVPGHLVRSFVTREDGSPVSGYSRTSHETLLSRRFGGWFVTGQTGQQHHLGNLFGTEAVNGHQQEPGRYCNLDDLSALTDTSRLLTPHSDLVALLVLQHQLHGQNLLTRAGFEHLLQVRSDVMEHLIRYLLFHDEPALTEPVAGTSPFAKEFPLRASPGPGRELRQLDLHHRLLKHRLSWLIDTAQFR